jgi:hypothetical protein
MPHDPVGAKKGIRKKNVVLLTLQFMNCRDSAFRLVSGGIRFESSPQHLLFFLGSRVFVFIVSSDKCRTCTSNKSCPLPSKSFQLHYS